MEEMLIFQSFIPGQVLFFAVPVSIQHNSSEGTLIQTCSALIKIKYSVGFYSEIYYSKPMQLPPLLLQAKETITQCRRKQAMTHFSYD